MFGIIAAILFGVAFFLHGAGFADGSWLDWASLALAGLFCLALHLLGVGPAVTFRRPQ